MKIPLTIIAGKSIDEVARERVQKSGMSEKVDIICAHSNQDYNLSNRYTRLPLTETLYKDFPSEITSRKKDRVLLRVSDCGDIPNSIVLNRRGEKPSRQEQVVIGEKIFLDREVSLSSNRDYQWSLVRGCYANLYANECFRGTFEALGDAFIKNTFEDPRKTRSWWYEEDSEGNHIYDLRLIVPSETFLYPKNGIYGEFIQPRLKALGYAACQKDDE